MTTTQKTGEAPHAPLSPQETRLLIQLARKAVRADLETRKAIQAQKIMIVPANFYSGIPTISEIENSFEWKYPQGPYNAPSVFDRAFMEEFLARMDEFAAEFDPSKAGDVRAPQAFFWENPAFSHSDAMAYYCVLRLIRPKHVLEIGSGFSTLVALQALERNGSGSLSCIEPFPLPWLSNLEGRISLFVQPVQSFEADFFNRQLASGDVLFIDSTHTVKAGSDCLHLYLRILPELRSDLTVHAHDIFLPFPMPAGWLANQIYWTEQYLLYAFLLGNARTKVLYGSNFHYMLNRAALDAFMRGRWSSGGGSFWFKLEKEAMAPAQARV